MAKSAAKTTTTKRRKHSRVTTVKSAATIKNSVPKNVAATKPALTAYPTQTMLNTKPDRSVLALPSAWRLARKSSSLVWHNRALFLGITAIYVILSLVLVQNLANTLNISDLRSTLSGSSDRFSNGLIAFQWLLGNTSATRSATSGVYEVLLVYLTSLAFVWALRQVSSGTRVRVRDSFYRGMYPLIPVAAVLVLIVVEFVPLLLGLGVYNIVVTYGFAESIPLRIIWALPVIALGLLSLLLATSTIIAAYIATLPDMNPLAALKSANKLVRWRRWVVLRKLLFVPLAVVIAGIVILAPFLLFIPVSSPWIAFALTSLCLPLLHSYMYTLYRELLM